MSPSRHLRRQLPLWITLGLLSALSACGGKAVDPLRGKRLLVFPGPPDTARVQFLARYSGSTDFPRQGSSFLQKLVGDAGSEERFVHKPYGISISGGKVYTCDVAQNAIQVADFTDRSFRALAPGGQGSLREPVNCDVSNGRVYVADPIRRQIVVLNEEGGYIDAFGDPSALPTDVVVDQGRIWTTNRRGRQVQVYDASTHEFLYAFPEPDDGPEAGLVLPTNLAVMRDRVYVTNQVNVQVYTLDGDHIRTIATQGDQPGTVARPRGLAVDSSYVLYLVDAAFELVQLFDAEGQLLMWFGGPYTEPGTMYLPAQIDLSYESLEIFQEFVHPSFELKYVIAVSNQFGPDKVGLYGFVEPRRADPGP